MDEQPSILKKTTSSAVFMRPRERREGGVLATKGNAVDFCGTASKIIK